MSIRQNIFGLALTFAFLWTAMPSSAQDALCRLALEVHTDASSAQDGARLSGTETSRRARELERQAGGMPELAFVLLRLSEVYDTYEGPESFAGRTFPILDRLSNDRPECEIPQMERVLEGNAVQWRPASFGAGAGDGSVFGWPVGDVPPEQTVAGIAFIAVVLASATWVHWYIFGRRARAPRFPCTLPIVVSHKGVTADTVMEDISAFGGRFALADHALGLGPGKRVSIASQPFQREARVQWANDYYVGVQFQSPIPEQIVGMIASLEESRSPREPTLPLGRSQS